MLGAFVVEPATNNTRELGEAHELRLKKLLNYMTC